FFTELEDLFVEHSIGTADLIQTSLRYVPTAEIPAWKNARRHLSAAATWDDFKKELLEVYPLAETEYVLSDLQNLVNQTVAQRMDSKAKLVSYIRDFNIIADSL
ncbi:hypothetical protein FA15DRAFT_548238, partial [Coprinopsis marcescibilis]